MSEYRVLISCPLIFDAIDEYADRFANHGIEYDIAELDQHLSESELLNRLEAYDGILAGDDELTAQVFEKADRLKVVSKWGIGIDSIDLAAADRHQVEVYNTPGAFATEVADVVLGYSIMLTRDLHHVDRLVRQGEWACPRGVSLSEATFGVIGVGNIGSAVAKRAAAHGMDVLGTDVEPIPDILREKVGVEAVEREELLKRSDIVSLNCALTDATRGMIGEEELLRIGPEGYLINTARGELVDQPKLVDALRTGEIAGAALDVFETEPLPADSPLTQLDNVILGSHNAQNTEQAVNRVNDRAVENLIEGLTEGSG